jgi:phosphoribosylformylglycinamidine cyclo-ligase
MSKDTAPLSYRGAGVDIDAADDAKHRITKLVESTYTAGTRGAFGGFGGMFRMPEGAKRPLLVSSADGVGTKLKVAFMTGKHDTVGADLVNHCVNDILVQGAEPLFFLDYYATGKLEVDSAAIVVEGIARACKESGCALIGGETAEMPGLYARGDFDLAGFCVGAVERHGILPRTGTMKAGDVLIGVASSGVHSNGFSLVRKVVEKSGLSLDAPAPFAAGKSLGEALLTPTRLYVRSCLEAIQTGGVKGLAHITGGGITDNLPRCLPDGLDAEVDLSAISVLPVFQWLSKEAGIVESEMLRTFNCGIGMVAVTDEKNAGHVIDAFQEAGQQAARIGNLIAGAGEAKVVYRGALKL